MLGVAPNDPVHGVNGSGEAWWIETTAPFNAWVYNNIIDNHSDDWLRNAITYGEYIFPSSVKQYRLQFDDFMNNG